MIDFDISRYEERIGASRRRMEAARRFEEGDMVPTAVSAGGSYFSWLFGVNIRHYYTDIDTQIEVQARAVKWRFENLDDDRTDYSLHLDNGPIGEAIVFGAEVVYPDNTSPRIVPFLETPADIERLEVRDPRDNPRVQEALERARKFKERAQQLRVPLPVGVSGVGIHPPLSCACAIMEPRIVYEMMANDPEPIQLLFRKCFDAFCMVKDYMDELFSGGKRSGHLGLADDNSAFVSDPMYREQVLPWNLRLYERYGFKSRSLHADGPNAHHFHTYVQDVKLTQMDIGGSSKIEPADEIL
ncbi:MAG: uroporphyrinogen decarboxylase family protein, partial [Armatimonadota bacterium]